MNTKANEYIYLIYLNCSNYLGCKCSKEGAIDGTCTDGRQCRCKNGYTGKRCDQCMPGFGTFPNCTGKCVQCNLECLFAE